MTGQRDSVRTTEYVEKDGKRLRCGFTTGSCAAAAAAAAAQMLLSGEIVREVEIRTPGGPLYRAQILEPELRFAENRLDKKGRPNNTEARPDKKECGEGTQTPVSCRCAVRKDGGDDPDITTGTLIAAEVFITDEPGISIDGGTGIGRVTKPGLDQPVGAAAINSVPRKMIAENVERVLNIWKNKNAGAADTGRKKKKTLIIVPDQTPEQKPLRKVPDQTPDQTLAGAPFGLRIIISAPEGEMLAQHTFNPRIGITGGISILGTTGIVEPMSDRAVVETIRTQMKVLRAQGRRTVVAAPGNYGLAFLTEKYGLREDEIVLISNYAAEAAELAAEAGFEGLLLAGHIGKLVKIAGGARNTHSMYGDRRMETLWEIAKEFCREQDREALRKELADCVMTDAALEVLGRYGVKEQNADRDGLKEQKAGQCSLKEQTAREMARRICGYLAEWSGGRLRAETIVFSNKSCELVQSAGAEEMLRSISG